LSDLDIHAPATRQPAVLAEAEAARRERESGSYRGPRARGGYVTYLVSPELHTNAAPSHAGWGETREEAYAAAFYWANQAPWVRTVPVSRAPRWAVEEANEGVPVHFHTEGEAAS